MAIRRVSASSVPEPPPATWSNCLVVDGIAYIAGLTARGSDFANVVGGGAHGQTQAIFAKMGALLAAAGGSLADVVKVTIYVTDIRLREEIWKARAKVFSDNFPVSTLIEISKLAHPEMLVEIDAIAHIGASRRG
ncbi:MAG: RidA family protein [Alphaproteobacteria bacterium]|nr:RidA family protein [Alphaproteobacteria bacterium]